MPAPMVATTKRALLVLSHAMERAFDAPADSGVAESPGLVLGLFQRREYFDVEAARYAALAAAGHTVIVGFSGSAAGLPPGVDAVTFVQSDPLAADWVLALCRGAYATALVAKDVRDLSPGEMTLESSRLYSARWTFDRTIAVADTREQVARIAGSLSSSVLEKVTEHLRICLQLPFTRQEAQLAAAADHLVYSVEAGQRRLMKLRSNLDDTKTMAERDQLTGLHNRHFLERFLGAADRPAQLVVVLVDVDNLKMVNDNYGHQAGDAVLAAVAAILKETSRAGDIVIRWGGDEFLLLVPDVAAVDAEALGQRLVKAVGNAHPAAPWDALSMSISVGIRPIQRTPLPLGELDIALQQAKRTGKGRAVVKRYS